MDVNPQKLRSIPWDVSMNMEDHTSFDTLWPNYAFDENHHNIHIPSSSSSQQFQQQQNNNNQVAEQEEGDQEQEEELGAMKEMMFKIAAMQPVDIDPATIRRPKRRNVRISDDPQSVAARHRRERISEKIRILQRLVPGGTKMDTASMLDEAIRYVKFLKRQIRQLQTSSNHPTSVGGGGLLFPACSTWASAAVITSAAAIASHKGSYSSTAAATGMTGSSVFGCNGTSDPMCFNHEVIGD